jgi:hypothetical protein
LARDIGKRQNKCNAKNKRPTSGPCAVLRRGELRHR